MSYSLPLRSCSVYSPRWLFRFFLFFFFQDQLFGMIVFDCKVQSGSLLFQDQLHRTDAHECCLGVDWVSVFQVGDWLHGISLTSYILLLLLLSLFTSFFAVLLNWFYPDPRVSPRFSQFFPPSHQGREEWQSDCGSSCWLGLNHDTQLNSFTAAKPLCLTSHTIFL